MLVKASNEPVMLSGLFITLAESTVLLAIQMGWLTWDSEQIASFNNFVVALIALLAVAIPLTLSWFARGKVTPLSNPKTADGKPAHLVEKE